MTRVTGLARTANELRTARCAIAGDKIFERFAHAASQEEGLISIEAIVSAFVFLIASQLGVGHLRSMSARHGKNGEQEF